MKLQSRTASLLFAGALTADLVAPTALAADSTRGCSGYAEPLHQSETFWSGASVEQVKACIAQFGTWPGSNLRRLTPLHLATLFSDDPLAVAVLLEGGAEPNAKEEQSGFTALHVAAQVARNPGIVAELLNGGADPNSKSELGFAPLHVAAQRNPDPAIVATLLKGGADPNGKGEGGFTPLHFAAQHSDSAAIVTELLKGGANPGARTEDDATPLHLAAKFNSNPAIVVALLEGGSDPNAKAGGLATPLHFAAYGNGNPAVIMALLNGGADPMITADGQTAFDLARNNGKLAGSAAYGRLKDAHDASKAERLAEQTGIDAKSKAQGADMAADDSVTWRGECSVGMELKPGEGCRISVGGEFKVASDGCVRALPDILRGSSDEQVVMSLGTISVSKGKTCFGAYLRYGKFAATENTETSSWQIEALP